VLLGRFFWWLEISLLREDGDKKKIDNEIEGGKRPARNQPCFETKRQRVRRVPGITERLVVSSPSVCGMRAHRML
jgi:hypothetical protein